MAIHQELLDLVRQLVADVPALRAQMAGVDRRVSDLERMLRNGMADRLARIEGEVRGGQQLFTIRERRDEDGRRRTELRLCVPSWLSRWLMRCLVVVPGAGVLLVLRRLGFEWDDVRPLLDWLLGGG